MKNRTHKFQIPTFLLPLLVIAALLIFLTSLSNLEQGRSAEGKRQLEDALRQASVACYAAEGIYPPDLDYLREHYGIQIDETRYTVVYDIFASNLMPDITVLEQTPCENTAENTISAACWYCCCSPSLRSVSYPCC